MENGCRIWFILHLSVKQNGWKVYWPLWLVHRVYSLRTVFV